METLIVLPENKKQLTAIKAVLKAMNVSFKQAEGDSYNPEFVAKIKRGEDAAKEGNGMKVDMANLWK